MKEEWQGRGRSRGRGVAGEGEEQGRGSGRRGGVAGEGEWQGRGSGRGGGGENREVDHKLNDINTFTMDLCIPNSYSANKY